jgi:hypothetical protein
MIAAATSESRPRGGVLTSVYALVGAVGLLTFVGAFVTLATLSGGAGRHTHSAAAHAALLPAPSNDIGRSLPTSFGVVAVEGVKKLTGLTPKQLAGMTHFPSWVTPDKMQVQVFLELTNLEKHPISYTPQQFRLIVGSGRPLPSLGTTFPGRILQPSASIDGQVTFVAPRRARGRAHLWLEFQDPGSKAPVRIDLGSARTRGRIPSAAELHQHLNHQQPPP